jgi:glycosyltransferase involved in cell wall biosynthesis
VEGALLSGSRPLRVLHVAQPTKGGVPAVVAGLVRDQVARGWTLAVAAPLGGDLGNAVRSAGGRHLTWPARRSPGPHVAGEVRRLARVIGRFDPDLVHLHSAKAGLAGRLALRGRRPTIYQPHAWSFDAVSGAVRAAALAWERAAARWADVLLCVSEAERRRGASQGIRGTWRVIENGIDLDAFSLADEAERAAARGRLGLRAGPLVVCVGRLTRQKGQDVLVAGWPRVRERVPDAELALVGSGPDREALAARRVPGVRLVGERRDVRDWLAAADAVAVPSRWEGMPLVLLEAMAVGRSVVAADVPGAREALGDRAGAVVAPGDPPALAGALVLRLLDRPRADAEGSAGRSRAEARFDLRKSAAAVARMYEALATAHS